MVVVTPVNNRTFGLSGSWVQGVACRDINYIVIVSQSGSGAAVAVGNVSAVDVDVVNGRSVLVQPVFVGLDAAKEYSLNLSAFTAGGSSAQVRCACGLVSQAQRGLSSVAFTCRLEANVDSFLYCIA